MANKPSDNGKRRYFLVASITISIVLIVIVLSAVILSVNRGENLEKISLSELDSKLASQEVDKLVVKNENIQVYLKESENGLDKPDNYAIRNDSGAPLSQELTSLEDASHGQAVAIAYDETNALSVWTGRIIALIIPIGAIVLIVVTGLVSLYFWLNKRSKKKPEQPKENAPKR